MGLEELSEFGGFLDTKSEPQAAEPSFDDGWGNLPAILEPLGDSFLDVAPEAFGAEMHELRLRVVVGSVIHEPNG